MTIPKVFVSYSHDSQAHKKWVLELATRLRKVGVDAALDQWDLGPGDDIPLFMERNLASADRVIMVCTEKYVEKANAGTGGVGYEKMIVTADLMKKVDSNKVIPIVRQEGTYLVPVFLKSKLYLDFSREDQFEESFDDLTRSIHNAPLFVKPEISTSPFEPIAGAAKRSGDALLELMSLLMAAFEMKRDGGYIPYKYVAERWPGSRAMLDILLEQAKSDGLITAITPSYINITLKGKMYAVENKLVE
ncbi:MAG: toll/interleukin-1 receptor domain-containing protein [Polynucleobacter sp.]|uniref:toll/interleukin-1 receptor domain-containing protein n=1 Tax=Limnobacter sp. TaxID=2003368 RepID=UPI0027349E46|nr:toll/interleukin-1 receptor domain-containing protein [Limnobacter sp.]MDP3272029.1 toll/interleukin-1 receptor domain-containing protein [Limnobacter sp.]MDZ4056676.1 toll/interleukin-1 receptor domain-containing protein [Polynucleobacter sp.]